MTTVADGKKLVLCREVVVVAAIGTPSIDTVTVLCICCCCNTTYFHLGASIEFILFYSSSILYFCRKTKLNKKNLTQDRGSAVSDPPLHFTTKPRPTPSSCHAKCCCCHGYGQVVVVSSVCSGAVVRMSHPRPPTSKRRGFYFF